MQEACREIVAIDGKTLRHSFDQGHGVIHMVSAMACQQRMVLGPEKVDENANEITAIQLLALLVLKGAAGCHGMPV